MAEVSAELGERAACGEAQALAAILSEIASRSNIQKAEALQIASNLRLSGELTPGQRRSLLDIGRACLQLGDPVIGDAIQMIANGSVSQRAPRRLVLEVESKEQRGYRLIRLDENLRLLETGVEVESGRLAAKIALDTDASYLLTIETRSDEPSISIPLRFGNQQHDLEPLNVDLEPWRGLDNGYVWIPPGRYSIGNDRGARSPLPSVTADVGPLVVARRQVRMKDYLQALVNLDERTRMSRLPSFMGEPLVSLEEGGWKPRGLRIHDSHNWLEVPVVGVDYDCALWYSQNHLVSSNLVGDLLTENEWEALARGPDGRLFAWGDTSIAGFANISRTDSSPSAGLEPVGFRHTDVSAFGLCDCSGNAEEWCKPATTGIAEGWALARGGSWYNSEQASRLASRVVRHADYRHTKLSFRTALRLEKA